MDRSQEVKSLMQKRNSLSNLDLSSIKGYVESIKRIQKGRLMEEEKKVRYENVGKPKNLSMSQRIKYLKRWSRSGRSLSEVSLGEMILEAVVTLKPGVSEKVTLYQNQHPR